MSGPNVTVTRTGVGRYGYTFRAALSTNTFAAVDVNHSVIVVGR